MRKVNALANDANAPWTTLPPALRSQSSPRWLSAALPTTSSARRRLAVAEGSMRQHRERDSSKHDIPQTALSQRGPSNRKSTGFTCVKPSLLRVTPSTRPVILRPDTSARARAERGLQRGAGVRLFPQLLPAHPIFVFSRRPTRHTRDNSKHDFPQTALSQRGRNNRKR